MAERRYTLPPNGKRAKRMTLSRQLCDVDLTLECKHCGFPLIKTGQWFMVARRFKCKGCKREVLIPYRDKLALFERHAHLA